MTLPKAPSPAPLISLFLHPLPWRLYPHTPLLQTHPSLVSLSKFPTPSSPSTYCHFLPKCGRLVDSTFTPKAVAQNVPCSSKSASLLPGLPQSSWRGRLALSFLHSPQTTPACTVGSVLLFFLLSCFPSHITADQNILYPCLASVLLAHYCQIPLSLAPSVALGCVPKLGEVPSAD